MMPRILITSSTVLRSPEAREQQSALTHLIYAGLIYEAGALPFTLPNLCYAEDAADILAGFDGLLLTGGADIAPAQFGEVAHSRLGTVDTIRDEVELALTRAAMGGDLPVLGICRGIQVLAVAAGGSLWQDIPTQQPANVGHNQTIDRAEASHPVKVVGDSHLARILRGSGGDEELLLGVNSFHHQAAKEYGNLQLVARSDDGIIEGLEADGARYIIGVQWHPEEMAASVASQNRLFKEFVRAASGK